MQIFAPAQQESMGKPKSPHNRGPELDLLNPTVIAAVLITPLSRAVESLQVLESQELLPYRRSNTNAMRKKL